MSRYYPEPPPEPKAEGTREIVDYIFRELNRLSQALFTEVYLNLEETFVAPDRPQEGDIVFADGTSWNPGSGVGIYAYIGGAWVKLNLAVTDDITVDDIIADDITANDITFTGDLIGSFKIEDNLIVNGAMQHSQENGDTASGVSGYYPADEFRIAHSTSTGVISTQRAQVVTPNGSADRFRFSVTTADTSIAAGEYLFCQHKIEGYKVAHLGWGASGAKPLVVRFGFKGPAGTYAVSVRNATTARSYVKTFVVADGNDAEYTLVFPGDTSGTWGKTTGTGIDLSFTVACGSTYQTTADTWAAGNFIATSAVSNGLGLNTNVFELFDVGAYADIDETSIPPKWKLPDYGLELVRCKRYYEAGITQLGGYGVAAGTPNMTTPFTVEKRAAPTITSSFTYNNASTGTTAGVSTTEFISQAVTTATAYNRFTNTWSADARI